MFKHYGSTIMLHPVDMSKDCQAMSTDRDKCDFCQIYCKVLCYKGKITSISTGVKSKYLHVCSENCLNILIMKITVEQ